MATNNISSSTSSTLYWNRISGLASGMDTESIVKKLMDAERIPLDKMMQKKQLLEWQRDAYREMNSLLLDLRNAAFDMKLQGTYLTKKVTSSNPGAVTATAAGSAIPGTVSIDVIQLAKGVSKISTNSISIKGADGKFIDSNGDGKITLNEQFDLSTNAEFTTNGNISFTLNGQKLTIENAASKTIYDVVNTINGANLGLVASYDSNLDRFFLNTKETGANSMISLSGSFLTDSLKLRDVVVESTKSIGVESLGGPNQSLKTLFSSLRFKTDGTPAADIQFMINGISFSYALDGGVSLTDVINDINNTPGINAVASYDGNSDRFSLTSTLEGQAITFSDMNNTTFLTGALKLAAGTQTGHDAKIYYDGVKFTHSTNQFSINGLNLTLNSTTSSPVQLTVSNDTDAVFDKIVQFIGKYNDTIDKINAKLSEPKYRDYPPLTDAQREAMTDQQVEKWEAKAKSGILQRDDLLQATLYQLRAGLSNSVARLDPSMNSMFDLGFTTGSYETNGKIIIDETKLRSALEQNPEKVMALFTQVDKNPNDNVDERGLAVRLYDSLNSAIKKLTDKAGSPAMTTDTESVIGKALDQLADDMSNFEARLKQIEDRYWRQFTAMEQAIQRANMQSGWLMQQFGGGQ